MMFRTLSVRTTEKKLANESVWKTLVVYSTPRLTLILTDIFQGKCQSRVFPFDNTNFAEGTFSDHSEETELVKVDYERRPNN